MKKEIKIQEFEDNVWYRPRMAGFIHECCDRGLKHKVIFKKKEKGILFKWIRINKLNK